MEPKPFPIINNNIPHVPDCPKSIPWDVLNEEWCRRNHGQTTFQLAARGGLSPCEALAVIERRRPWGRMGRYEAIVKLKAACSTSDAATKPCGTCDDNSCDGKHLELR